MRRHGAKLRSTPCLSVLRIKESFDLWPIFLHDKLSPEMATSRKKIEFYARSARKTIHNFPGNVGIIFGVKHQDLGRGEFFDMMGRVIKYAAMQFVPVSGGEAVSVAKR